jgi:hypothetical protein
MRIFDNIVNTIEKTIKREFNISEPTDEKCLFTLTKMAIKTYFSGEKPTL